MSAQGLNELWFKYLAQYAVPKGSCTLEGMMYWTKRLGLMERDYRKWAGIGYAEFIELNPGWSLHAFIGLLLELRHEKGPRK